MDNTLIAFAPLIGYKSDCENIELGAVSIRHLPELELIKLWKTYNGIFSMVMTEYDFMANKYCLWAEIEHTSPIEPFNLVVKSLRLWKEGTVGYNKYFLLPLHGHDSGECQGTYAFIVGLGQPKFIMKIEEVEDFISFFHKLEAVQTKIGVLNIALSRLGYSYERNRADDRLIDLMIAYESLFCLHNRDIRKFPNRVAKLLEPNTKELDKIQENIKEAYKIRGWIVHNSRQISRHAFWSDSPEKKILTPDNYLPIIEAYLRRCLSFMIDKAYASGEKLDKAKILRDIDLG
jgi:hypothetical protein